MSTVATLLDPAGAGVAVEIGPGDAMAPTWRPVIVGRSSAYGTASAAAFVRAWPDGVPTPWLVIVADAPAAPPPAARFYLRAVRDRVAGIVHLPYLPPLRSVVRVDEVLTLPVVERAGRDLRRRLSAPPSSRSIRPRRSAASPREDL